MSLYLPDGYFFEDHICFGDPGWGLRPGKGLRRRFSRSFRVGQPGLYGSGEQHPLDVGQS